MRREKDSRRVDDHGHSTFTVTGGRTVQPQRGGAVDLDAPDVAVVGEARVDARAAVDGLARRRKTALRDRVALAERELDPVALRRRHRVRGECEARADLDAVHA